MKLLTREQTLSAIQQLTHRQLKVYLCIVSYYNDKYGYSSPTAETISNDTGTPRKKVYEAIRCLEKMEFIRTEKNPEKKYNENNIYYILDKTSVPNDIDVTPDVTVDVTVDVTPDVTVDVTPDVTPVVEDNPKTYLQYPTPESITCLSDGELKQLWSKLDGEKRFYNVSGIDSMRYNGLMDFIRETYENRWMETIDNLNLSEKEIRERQNCGVSIFARGVDPV